jgi:hypothetical protein
MIVADRPQPCQGYYFRIPAAQGPDLPSGTKDYLRNCRMTDGFVLTAWPACYSVSGIMTFEINRHDVVFHKDLGCDTARAAARLSRFNPELTWPRVTVTGDKVRAVTARPTECCKGGGGYAPALANIRSSIVVRHPCSDQGLGRSDRR